MGDEPWTKHGQPDAKVTVAYKGKTHTSSTDKGDAHSIIEGFSGLLYPFITPKEIDNFRVHGGYHENGEKRKINAYLLRKKM